MIILIDDDKLIHLSWKMKAKKRGISIQCFFSIDEFLGSYIPYSKDVKLFVDSNLSSTHKGEIESKKLYELGYKEIYLTTSYTDLSEDTYPWLSGVISKTPPF